MPFFLKSEVLLNLRGVNHACPGPPSTPPLIVARHPLRDKNSMNNGTCKILMALSTHVSFCVLRSAGSICDCSVTNSAYLWKPESLLNWYRGGEPHSGQRTKPLHKIAIFSSWFAVSPLPRRD